MNVAHVLRQGMLIAAAGAITGGLAALATGRVMSSLLFGVNGGDPLTFAASLLGLGAIATVAVYIPARRASQTSPIESLRMD